MIIFYNITAQCIDQVWFFFQLGFCILFNWSQYTCVCVRARACVRACVHGLGFRVAVHFLLCVSFPVLLDYGEFGCRNGA